MALAIVARQRGGGAAVELADHAVGDAEDRGVHEGRVIAVAFVLEDELPVGLHAVLEEAGGDLHLAFRRSPHQAVDGLDRAAEVLPQRRPFRRERAEHKAAIGFHARDAAERELRLVLPLIAVGEGVADQAAVIGKGPGVERTGEGARVALFVGADLVAAVRAAVEQQIDLALLVARHDHGLRADRLDDVVVRRRHLALVADIDPGAVPDVLQLGFEEQPDRCRASRAPGRRGSSPPIATRAAPRSSLLLPNAGLAPFSRAL